MELQSARGTEIVAADLTEERFMVNVLFPEQEALPFAMEFDEMS